VKRLKNKSHFISVVIPAFKNEKTIVQDIKNIKNVLEGIRYDYEIVVVVDGIADRTFERAKTQASEKIKVVSYKVNKGKGNAVRYGMARTKGDLVAFMDSGSDLDAKGIPILLEHMNWYDSDIIVASIRHSASKVYGYPIKRKLFSIGYHWLTRFLFGLRVTDSQRGLKIFRRQVLEKVLPRLLVKQFAFDIEMLSVARSLGFEKIHDGPVEMDAAKLRQSHIRSGTVFSMLWDTMAVFYRLKILHYYDDTNKRKWRYDPDLNFRINIV
jgi:glycosyltransferase involved in cell wall biosynthesis